MMTIARNRVVLEALILAIAVTTFVTGCASHNFVREQDQAQRAELGHELDEMSSEIERVDTQVAELEGTVGQQGERVEGLSRTAQEALERATAADKLAQGKFLYETVLSGDEVRFGFEQTALSEEARQALDRFAAQLKERNEDLFVEIQGHTDSSGEESYNLLVGEHRAESVRRYLSREHGMALHRVAVISYGEAAPLVDNSTPENRSRNRRVSLVVLQ